MSFVKNILKVLGVDYSLTYFFNFGSLLGFIIISQVLSGLILVIFYIPSSDLAFISIQYLIFEVNFGWFFRLLHFNGASILFFFLYLHFFKAIFFASWNLYKVWSLGLIIIIFLIIEAFLGYSLVWSQISFWAATVITRLLRVIPFLGKYLVLLIWGGYSLNRRSLRFFFLIHFLLPFLILIIINFHLIYLHFYGSRINLGISSKLTKRPFYSFFWIKDSINLIFFFLFFLFIFSFPFKLGDSLGFLIVNDLVSPVHIVPEWYFLWAYAILRAFPSKVFGVFILFFSIIIFFGFKNSYKTKNYKFLKLSVIFFIYNSLFLTWLGGAEPLFPFVGLRLIFSIFFIVFSFIIWFSVNFLVYFKENIFFG